MEEQKKQPLVVSFRVTLVILGVVSLLVLGSVFYMASQVDDFSDYQMNVDNSSK